MQGSMGVAAGILRSTLARRTFEFEPHHGEFEAGFADAWMRDKA